MAIGNIKMSERTVQRIGNYCLIRLLGKGSSSTVYLGEQVEHKTQVAIKIFQARLPASEQKKFLAEVKSLQELKHPHLIPILEAGIEGDRPFLAMAYASSGSLRQYYPAGIHLSPRSVVSYAQEIASALQYLHEHQIIHHQVRPENLLLQENHHLLLSDLGLRSLAKGSRSQDLQELTRAVAYMAPEQLQGQPCPASDQYALAIMLYEWLSGEVPFHGSLREIVVQQAFKPPPPLHEKVPEITSAVEEVVLISLAKDPKWRFGNVQAFVHALEHACSLRQSVKLHTFFSSGPSSLPVGQQDKALASLGAESAMRKLPNIDLPPPPKSSRDTDKPASLSSVPTTAIPKIPECSRLPAKKVMWLAAMILLVTFSVVGLLSGLVLHLVQADNAHQPALTLHAAAGAATQSARASTTTEATAQAQALSEATATAGAENNLYIQTTQSIPATNDPLSYNTGNRWNEGTSSLGESCVFTGGVYHVIEPNPGNVYPCFANVSNFKDFAFQIQMTILKGDAGGLVFLADQTHTNFSAFGLLNNGSYQEANYHGDYFSSNTRINNTPIVGYKSPQSNWLTVIVRNSRIFMYVNSSYVGSFKENSATPSGTGEIGVFARDDKLSADVTFSHARVWQL